MLKNEENQNNIYCFNCKRIITSNSDICPICNKKGKIVGTAIRLGTSNGKFPMHI